MPSLRRNKQNRREKHKPEVVTGSFELHYEDVVKKNHFAIITVFASALVLFAAFIPGAVYQSIAEPEEVNVEVETGIIINPEYVTKVKGDITASGDGYIEFKLVPEN
jgi:hypothetical protein